MKILCLDYYNFLINISILSVNVLMLLFMIWQLLKANKQIKLQTEQLKFQNLAEYNKTKKELKLTIKQYCDILEKISFDKLATLYSNPQFDEKLENDIENLTSRLIKLDIDKSIFYEIQKLIISRSNVSSISNLNDYRNNIKNCLNRL